MDFINFKGKKILITGASSGIGAETAHLLSELDAQIILIARREEQLKETIRSLKGNSHSYYIQDLAELEQLETLVKDIVKKHGALDGFVHSAGISCVRPIAMIKPSVMQNTMNINFGSFIEIVRCLSRKGRFNSGMSIVGVSSVAGQQGNQSKTAYCASKAAMDAAVRCLGKELAPKHIRINTVAPGMIKTAIYEQFKSEGTDSADAASIIERQYLGLGEPVDVANMIAYLLSDKARLISGSTIAIDGERLTS